MISGFVCTPCAQKKCYDNDFIQYYYIRCHIDCLLLYVLCYNKFITVWYYRTVPVLYQRFYIKYIIRSTIQFLDIRHVILFFSKICSLRRSRCFDPLIFQKFKKDWRSLRSKVNSHSIFVFAAVLTAYLFRQWLACVRVPNWKNNVLGVELRRQTPPYTYTVADILPIGSGEYEEVELYRQTHVQSNRKSL